jgi:hypothetical protein
MKKISDRKNVDSKKVNFNEFVDEATRQIHSALLEGGGKEMRLKVFLYISSALILSDEGKFKFEEKK